MIFHDKTLWNMVEAMPVDLSTLGSISGVGKAKLEKYGSKFLSALKEGA
jgi:ATP-dependent DNA helicase RecQ